MDTKIKLMVKKMSFQEQVKFVRMQLQLGQEELACRMGISLVMIGVCLAVDRKKIYICC